MKRIGILRGGTGEHYASSLKRGGDIILHIHENLSHKYKVVDILIDKDHIWHFNGLPISPSDLPHKVDIVWNTTHPSFSNILDSLSIPNIGGSAFSSALGTSREMLRKHMAQIGVSIPRQIVSPKSAREVFEKFGNPWIVKTHTEIKIAKTFNELAEIIHDKNNVVVEEFITGKVASLHSVPNFRGQDFYIFPPVNIFGEFSSEEKEKLLILVKELHSHIGAKHYLKSNFLLDKRGKIYLMDFESTPNLKSFSHFSQACEKVGAKMYQVVEHILEKAYSKNF